jgi:uncharacterized delta-60 repeat protein
MSTDLDITTFNSPNGFLKTTFNTLPSPPETLPQDVAVSVLIRSDNRIVMGGYSQYSTGSYITLSCYNTDGSLYTAFGVGGKVLAAPTFSSSNFIVNDVILQPNDHIIVTGSFSSAQPSIFVSRFDSSGILDGSFGTGGYVIITPSAFGTQFDQCYSNSVVLQSLPPNDYIVLGGYVRRFTVSNKNFIALVRLTTNGTPDTSFGTSGNGTVYSAFNLLTNNEDFCNCLSIQTDGKIVSGGVNSLISGLSQTLSVSRFTTGGILDTTFNSSGVTPGWLIIPNNFPSLSYNYNFSSGIGINSVGQIIISSYITKTSGEQCFGLAAVTSSGTLDTSFGTLGQTILDLSLTYNLTGTAFSNGANALALQSDNKIVITGGFLNTTTSAEGFSLARFDTSGTLDSTFGLAGLGYILSDLDSPNTEVGYSVAIQSDGKVLIGGTEINFGDESGSKNFILARYFGFPPVPPPIPPVPPPIPPNPPIPTPIVPICFPAGTPVLTDQGYIAIEEIQPELNTIRGKEIVAITKTITNHDKIVCFDRHSLGYNVPNKRTFVSLNHGIIYNKKLIPAKKFVGKKYGVYFKKYNGEYLYNVLMEKHTAMLVNGMKVETLDPKNMVAKLYTDNYSPEQKQKIILQINNYSYNRYSNFQNYERLQYNRTRRLYEVHRYNPIIGKLHLRTQKNYSFLNNINREQAYKPTYNQTIRNRIPLIKHNSMIKLNTNALHRITRYGRRRR